VTLVDSTIDPGGKVVTDTITCPKCGSPIAVSEILAGQIRQRVRLEFDQEAKRKDRELEKQAEAIREQARQVQAEREAIEQEIAARMAQEQARLVQEARHNAELSVGIKIQDLQGQLAAAKDKLVDAQKTELQLRKERRDWEEQRRELELTVSRTLDEERERIRERAKLEAIEQHRLQQADKEKLIGDLRLQIDELKRKSEQGPHWLQGEVLEIELEAMLRQHFPADAIEPVPASKAGGDVLQHVRDYTGQVCGTVLWESKRTKCWNDAWLAKLRNDQIAAQAAIAVLLSDQLPKEVRHAGCIDSIWVTDRVAFVGLAMALRAGLLELARVRRSLVDRRSKEDLVYRFVSGPEFRQRVETIVQTVVAMKRDLEAEKRSFCRIWARRDKQIARVVNGIATLHGDLDGMIGGTLPEIPELEVAQIGAEMAADAPVAIEPMNGCPF
jgi:hypothetical protein